jgi:hypothetical protein
MSKSKGIELLTFGKKAFDKHFIRPRDPNSKAGRTSMLVAQVLKGFSAIETLRIFDGRVA